MFAQIENYIRNCAFCQKNKSLVNKNIPMKITSTSSKSFEKIFLDIVGPLPSTHKNNKYILTMQCDLTKFSIAIPLPDQEAETVANAFVHNFICVFGSPSILTDQGTNFMGKLYKHICKLLRIQKINSSAYHPQTNGALERSHKTIIEYLRNYVEKDPLDWDSWLQFAMFSYNTTPHTSTNFMPYELVFGYKPNIPDSISKNVDLLYNYDDYFYDLKFKLQNSFKIAHDRLVKGKEKSKQYYDQNTCNKIFNIGDQVFLKNEARKSKLDSLWLGPYLVVEVISPENTKILIGRSERVVHNNRLKLCQT